MDNKKVLFVVAFEGYQHIEYGTPKKILTDAGYHVVTASNMPGAAIAKDGSTTNVDVVVNQAQETDYNAIIFIGGPGTLESLDNQNSYQLLKKAVAAGLLIGAICIAPRILAKAGVLASRRATGWNEDHELAAIFKEYDVQYVQQPVVVDGNIITAVGPSAAQEFGQKIVSLLQS